MAGLRSYHNIFQGAELREYQSVLVDHADTGSLCLQWMSEDHRLAAPINRSTVGLKVAKKQLEEGGFASAVFAYQSMNLAFVKAHVDVQIGPGVSEALGDSVQADDRRSIVGEFRVLVHDLVGFMKKLATPKGW